MTIYLIKGFLGYYATSLADAQALFTALQDQTDPDNLETISKLEAKQEALVQSDTGEPLIVSSIDDAAGTISSWVTDGGTTIDLGLGDPDAHNSRLYARADASAWTISGSTRTATLALNTTELTAALSGFSGKPGRINSAPFTIQIRKTAGGYSETVGLFRIQVTPGVLTAAATDLDPATYLTAAQVAAGYQPLDSDLTAIAALTTTTFGRALLTQATAAATLATLGIARALSDNAQTVAAAGTTTLSIASTKPIHTEVLTITGAAGTYVVVLPTTDRQAGDLALVRVVVPATIGIAVDIRDATAGGTQLLAYTTETTSDPNLFFAARYNGTAWTRLVSLAA